MTPAPAGDGPCLHHGDYWVAADQAADYPVRQGDLFANLQTVDGDHLEAALIVHPTCELTKASVTNVQVARVRPLDALPDESQRQRVVAGLAEESGVVRFAFAHTFFVAPANGTALDFPMWADLRDLVLAPRGQCTVENRVGALGHDGRVTFIRRYLYFRLRWALSFDQVRDVEAHGSPPIRRSRGRAPAGPPDCGRDGAGSSTAAPTSAAALECLLPRLAGEVPCRSGSGTERCRFHAGICAAAPRRPLLPSGAV